MRTPPLLRRLLRRDDGAATMQWAGLFALLVLAAFLAWPDFGYTVGRALHRSDLDGLAWLFR